MKKSFAIIAAVALVGFIAGSAAAQPLQQNRCLYNSPAKAKGFKTSMVRAFAACPGVTQSINSSSGGFPTCTPPFALSSYQFGPKGKCDVKVSHKNADPCPLNPAQTDAPVCAEQKLIAKCSDIRQSDGLTPINAADDTGWALQIVARTTFLAENDTGTDVSDDFPVTLIDFPVTLAMGAPKRGKVLLKTTLSELLATLGGALPACTSIQIVSMSIADPTGNIFAKMGSAGIDERTTFTP